MSFELEFSLFGHAGGVERDPIFSNCKTIMRTSQFWSVLPDQSRENALMAAGKGSQCSYTEYAPGNWLGVTSRSTKYRYWNVPSDITSQLLVTSCIALLTGDGQ